MRLFSYFYFDRSYGVFKSKRRTNLQENANSIEITLRHGCSPVKERTFFRIPFPKNTSERLLRKR